MATTNLSNTTQKNLSPESYLRKLLKLIRASGLALASSHLVAQTPAKEI